jgi:hypothetical protein
MAARIGFTRDDFDHVIVWVRHGGFPGALDDEDVEEARRVLRGQPTWTSVLVDAGGGALYRIDLSQVEEVELPVPAGVGTDSEADSGFEAKADDGGLGSGDGATLAGYPLGWKFLRYTCPDGCTVLLSRHPVTPPRCPAHDCPMKLTQE